MTKILQFKPRNNPPDEEPTVPMALTEVFMGVCTYKHLWGRAEPANTLLELALEAYYAGETIAHVPASLHQELLQHRKSLIDQALGKR